MNDNDDQWIDDDSDYWIDDDGDDNDHVIAWTVMAYLDDDIISIHIYVKQTVENSYSMIDTKVQI